MAAAWSEQGTVGIWSLDQCLQKVDQPGGNTEKDQREAASPLFNFKGHQTEGFAMNWSPTMPGVLATGTLFWDIVQLNKCETDPYFLQTFQCRTMFISAFCKICELNTECEIVLF